MSVGFKQARHGRTEHTGAAGVLEVFCRGSFRRREWVAGGTVSPFLHGEGEFEQ